MKNSYAKQLMDRFYDIRAALYTLLIGTGLLFLLNMRELGIDNFLYFAVTAVLFIISASEFLYSMRYAGTKYHREHPLRELYIQLRSRHLYNVILLPVVQYLGCVLIIFLNQSETKDLSVTYITIINLSAVCITVVMTYFTFVAYKKIYSNDLYISSLMEEFFDASKYVSFAFLTYVVFLLQRIDGFPRYACAILVGVIQLLYLCSALWRRNKFGVKQFIIITIASIVLSLFAYGLLVLYTSKAVAIVMFLTAQVVILDYVMTSLLIKWVEKRFTKLVFIEYMLVALISVSLLFFSR